METESARDAPSASPTVPSAEAMETGGAAVRAADIPRASLTVVLVDSTGYTGCPGKSWETLRWIFASVGAWRRLRALSVGAAL